jgi:transcriptional regulator with XRE-family HTH domain
MYFEKSRDVYCCNVIFFHPFFQFYSSHTLNTTLKYIESQILTSLKWSDRNAMGKYLEAFKIRLKEVFDAGKISQAELHRKTGISGSMINRYLKGAEPGLCSIELIAEALECDPRDLIKPEGESEKTTISVDEHLKTLEMYIQAQQSTQEALQKANGLCQKQAKQIQELESKLSEPALQKILSVLSTLDDSQKRSVLRHAEMLKRTGASSSGGGTIENTKNKIK